MSELQQKIILLDPTSYLEWSGLFSALREILTEIDNKLDDLNERTPLATEPDDPEFWDREA